MNSYATWKIVASWERIEIIPYSIDVQIVGVLCFSTGEITGNGCLNIAIDVNLKLCPCYLADREKAYRKLTRTPKLWILGSRASVICTNPNLLLMSTTQSKYTSLQGQSSYKHEKVLLHRPLLKVQRNKLMTNSLSTLPFAWFQNIFELHNDKFINIRNH